MPDPENIVLEFEIAFLCGLEAEIRVLPVLAAAILKIDFRLRRKMFQSAPSHCVTLKTCFAVPIVR